MPLSTAARNAAVVAIAAQATYLSLHSDTPDALGSNELIGGSPLYARQPATWTYPSAGTMLLGAPASFDVPVGSVAFVGLWSALTLGDFLGYAPINGGTVRGAAFARATTDDFYSPAHSLVVGDRVSLYPLPGLSLPTGAGTALYYVVSVTTPDVFQLALTPLDAPLALTSDGDVEWQRAAVDVFGAQGVEVVSDLSFVIGT